MSYSPHKDLIRHLFDILRGALRRDEVAEQIAHLLYLKFLDEEDEVRAATGQPCIFEGAAERYRWRVWSKFQPKEMDLTLRDGVFPYLASLVRNDTNVGDYFRSVSMTIDQPQMLASAVGVLSSLRILEMDIRDRGALFDELLASGFESQYGGQFRTPLPLRELLLDLTQPTLDDSILDPCCGIGGVIAEAYERTHGDSSVVAELHSYVTTNRRIKGVELSWPVARLARLNLIFHGLTGTEVTCGNALTNSGVLSDNEFKRGFSLVIAVPPFGGRVSVETVRPELATKSKLGELLFLELSIRALAPGGRAAVVVPDGVLFGSTEAHVELRRKLVEEQQLLAVIALSAGAFAPYTTIKTNVLLFRKPESGQTPGAHRVWFYELTSTRSTKSSSEEPYSGAGELARLWNTYANSNFRNPPGVHSTVTLDVDAAEPQGWWTDRSGIKEKNFVLTPNFHKPRRKETLVPPETLRARLVEALAALDEAVRRFEIEDQAPSLGAEIWSTKQMSEVTCEVPAFSVATEPNVEFIYVEISSLDRERNVITKPKQILGQDISSRKLRRLQKGDVLISTIRPAATGIALVTQEWDGALASGDLCVLRANTTVINSDFLLQLCLDRSFIKQLNSAAGGSTIPRVSESVIRSIVVQIPPLLFQQRLVDSLTRVEALGRVAASVTETARDLQHAIRMGVFQHRDLSSA